MTMGVQDVPYRQGVRDRSVSMAALLTSLADGAVATSSARAPIAVHARRLRLSASQSKIANRTIATRKSARIKAAPASAASTRPSSHCTPPDQLGAVDATQTAAADETNHVDSGPEAREIAKSRM